jgi:hypothetical protein
MRGMEPYGLLLLAGLVFFVAATAEAQAPPYPAAPPASPEAAEIARCLCLHRDLGALGADMAARRRAYDELQRELGAIDAELQHERTTIDVNDPDAIARFRQQLARRDALFERSTGPVAGALSAAVARYNAAVGRYNAQCANRPRDPVLLSQVEANLVCPAP